MAQTMTFPREFELGLFGNIDRNFLTIWFVSFVLLSLFTFYMQSLPVKEMSADQIRKYAEVIYRVKVREAPKVEVAADTRGATEETVAEEEEVEEEKPVTEVDKVAAAEAAREARKARQEAQRRAVADRIKVLAGPTGKGSSSRSAARAGRATIGLEGAMGGVDVKDIVGMVGDAGTASKVKKLRGGGAAGIDIGDISIEELRALSADDINLMLNEAPMQLDRRAITAKGKGTKAKQRSQGALSEIILANKNQVQYCYWTLKRRDSTLKGRVVVEFTIAPTGEVVRVRFSQSNWGGNKLGSEVERCISSIISQWHFDPISESEGNVTAGATYIFE